MKPRQTREDPRARRLVAQSLLMAAALAALKTAAGVGADSLSLLASALDSLMDLLSSAVNFVSLSLSAEPADEEHPYGHGKIEAVAGAAQGVVIALGGLALLAEALRRVAAPQPARGEAFGMAVMLLSMALSALHSRRLARAAGESGSPILRAEGLHFGMDFLANLGVLAGLAFIRLGASPAWDLALSLAISAWVLRQSVTLVYGSVQELIDRRASLDLERALKDLILAHHPSIVGYHDFRTRRSGRSTFIDFHIEIRGVERFAEAHEIAESLVERIEARVPGSDVTVHYDPEGAR